MAYIDAGKILNELLFNNEPLLLNTALFLFLFLFFIGIYSLIYKKIKIRNIFVVAFSIYFYYKSGGIFVLLLLLSVVVGFFIGKFLDISKKKPTRIFLLILSLLYNLGLLIYFKYTNFIFSEFFFVMGKSFTPFNIIAPIGISFFTFQGISYSVDIYKRQIKPISNIIDYCFYLTFFPKVLVGPLVKNKEFIPQISNEVNLTKDNFGKALFLIISGLIKKAIISDYISMNFVDRIFDDPLLYSGIENLFAAYGYSLQIYCDFSGFTDIALGVALLMGFTLPENFRSPYKSTSITDFWRRWHISLSTWLKDYLYISLGGNKKGKLRTYVNLLITMLLGGLWHGATLNFVFWGLFHGIALVFEKITNSYKLFSKNIFLKITSIFLTFNFVTFCWIFFRADDFTIAYNLIKQVIFSFHGEILFDFIVSYKYVMILFFLGFLLVFIPTRWKDFLKKIFNKSNIVIKLIITVLVIFIVMQLKSSEIQPLIYFNF